MSIFFQPAAHRLTTSTETIKTFHSFTEKSEHQGWVQFGMLIGFSEFLLEPSEKGPSISHNHYKQVELITIIISGEMQYWYASGQTGIQSDGYIHVFSAGSGDSFGFRNSSPTKPLHLLQISILPDDIFRQPSTNSIKYLWNQSAQEIQRIVSPHDNQKSANIFQDAFISLGNLQREKMTDYLITDPSHGLFVFVISGNVIVGGIELSTGDGVAVVDYDRVELFPHADSKIILVEIPME